MSKKHHIIIGSSAAAMGALSKITSLDRNAHITCISASEELPYNTCLLVDYMCGDKGLEELYTRPSSFFTEHGIKLHLKTRVTHLDPQTRTITCDTGQILPFDTLFLGLGTSIVIPPIPGCVETDGVFFFHTLEDVVKLSDFIKKHSPKKAIIVGAGLSGIECADALITRGIDVEIVEAQNQLLPSLTSRQGSEFLENLLERHDVAFHLNTRITDIKCAGDLVAGVELNSGAFISCDLVIFTIGGKPNSTLAERAGIVVQDGAIFTNEHMQTSIPSIYAGGDVALIRNTTTGLLQRSCLWPDAMLQGMTAGSCMAGTMATYPGSAFVSSSKFFGLSFASCSNLLPLSEHDRLEIVADENFHHTFMWHGEQLKAFSMIGNIDNLGILRKRLVKF